MGRYVIDLLDIYYIEEWLQVTCLWSRLGKRERERDVLNDMISVHVAIL